MATTSRRSTKKPPNRAVDTKMRALQDAAKKVNENMVQASSQRQKAETALRALLSVNEEAGGSLDKMKRDIMDMGGEGYEDIHKLQMMNEINTRLIKSTLTNLSRLKNLKENTLSIS